MKELQEANLELEKLNLEMREIADERIRVAKSNHAILRSIKKMHNAIAKSKEEADKPPTKVKPKSSTSDGGNEADPKKKRRPRGERGGKQSGKPESLHTTSAPIKAQLPPIEEEHP